MERAIRALIPWETAGPRQFPGFNRAATAITGTSDAAIRQWRRGARRPSLRVLARVLAAIVERRDTLAALALELEAEIKTTEARREAAVPPWMRHQQSRHAPGDAP